MDDTDRLIVELLGRYDKLDRALDQAGRTTERKLSAIEARGRAFGSRFSAALGAVSAVALVAALAKIADEAKSIDATLKLATASFGSFGKAQDDVRGIADRTRSGLQATSDLYATFARNGKELGLTQAEVSRATETFAQTLKISGATTGEASAATLQFSQALASGVLRGDEFNTVMEQAPRLSKLLADSLGVPVTALREMAFAGQLTADKLTKALTDTKLTDGLQGEFNQLPVTFDQAMQRVYDSAIITFGAFDRGGEFSTMLASFIVDGTEDFAGLEKAAEDFGIEVRATLAGLSDAFQPLYEAGLAVFEALGLGSSNLGDQIRNNILLPIDQVSGWLSQQGLLGSVLTGNGFSAWWNDKPRTGTTLVRDYDAGKARMTRDLNAKRTKREVEAAKNNGGEGGTPAARPASAAEARAAKAAAAKAARDLAAFTRDEASLTENIARAKAEMAIEVTDRAAAEQQATERTRANAVAEVQANDRYSAAQKARLVALINQVSAMQDAKTVFDRDVAVAKESLDIRLAALKDSRDALSAQADLADTREERRDIEMRLLDLAYQQERAELEGIIASQDATKAQKAIAQKRLDMLGSLQNADAAGVDRRFESPLQKYRRGLTDTSISDQVEDLVGQELDYFRDSLRNSITKRLGIKDPLLAGIVDLFIQSAIIRPLAKALAGGSGGGGGFLKGVVSVASSFFGRASGGYVGPGQTVRVNESSAPGRVEGFRPTGSGEVIPLGRMAPTQRSGGITIAPAITIDARGSSNPVETARLAKMAAYEALGEAAPALIAQARSATIRQMQRPRLPGSLG